MNSKVKGKDFDAERH